MQIIFFHADSADCGKSRRGNYRDARKSSDRRRIILDHSAQPLFLYESLWCLLVFLMLMMHLRKRVFQGEIF